jgi:muramoyltetrapeptide carboxypeptidase LdcA involved in peptidoglycan recycling
MKAKRKERVAGVTTKRIAPLTKAEMIVAIQRLEAQLFLRLKITEESFGQDSRFTESDRTRWAGVNDAMKVMGIKADLTLPDNVEATAIIINRLRV